MTGDGAQGDPAGLQLQEEKYVVGDQAAPSQNLDGKEVSAGEDRHVGRDELPPRGVLAALGRRCNPVPLQNVPYSLGRYLVTEVGQCADHGIVNPTGVLPSHADNELFDGTIHPWPTGITASPGAIELPGNQPTIPCQDGSWFGNARHLGQIFTTEPLADLGEREAFRIRDPEAWGKLGAQNPILRGQVFAL
jgi:hypothetical protein